MFPSQSILQHIGQTPLVPLARIGRGLPVPVLVKCEHLNPGGSIKDRIALAIVDDAEARGALRAGMTLIEATAGNTGVGLALVARPARVSARLRDAREDVRGQARRARVETGRLGADGAYAVEGIGGSEVPENLHRDVLDGAERVSDAESFAMVKRLVREEGLLVGGSSGTNVVAALRLAARGGLEGPVVTVLPDSWDRYRATPWMQAWAS